MSFRSLFSKSDRRGLLVLEYLAILILVLMWAFSNKKSEGAGDGAAASQDSLSVGSRSWRNKPSKTYTYAVPEVPVESFPFDPNTADSTTLLRLGLAPWQVQAIYRYRAKHGRYHSAEDFKRLPGMTAELWERLGKYVEIDPKFRLLEHPSQKKNRPSEVAMANEVQSVDQDVREQSQETDTVKRMAQSVLRDTVNYPVKFEELTLVDINAADTSLLKKIPNIGSFRARMIVGYRERLGGYVRVEQVMEACEMPDEVLEWFSLVPVPVKTLNVNRLSVRQLMKHPYISFYQARSIVEHRGKNNSIQQVEELLQLENFSTADIERLRPYLIFE